MGLGVAREDDLEIVEENDPYFIGRTDQWTNRPDGQVCLGYITQYNKLIISSDAFELLGEPEEYNEKSSPCRKNTCIGKTVLSSRGNENLHDLGWCSNCHTSAKEAWTELIKNNPELGVSHLV